MFDPTTLVGFHTWLSLFAIVFGALGVAAALSGNGASIWVPPFLATAILTSATGYLLPAPGVLPSHVVGAIALIVLAILLYARFVKLLKGFWGGVDAVCMVSSLYFLVFVAVAQAFLKIPALARAAPTGTEAPFAGAQICVLLGFIYLGWIAVRNKHRPAHAG
ncbi:hypothetical protein [Aquabacter spiritensis]|uniref:Uncharacterized protein n=1 Tax=Aquabacter spiritensis TaxID=933073 RepID=A0A4R3LMX4_9HYPH|nr:hypothetical protein [Aquabacter spiritensis]TCT00996.1 hypothetical protein EDC64_12084 [Aquabacter spiritensis]